MIVASESIKSAKKITILRWSDLQQSLQVNVLSIDQFLQIYHSLQWKCHIEICNLRPREFICFGLTVNVSNLCSN